MSEDMKDNEVEEHESSEDTQYEAEPSPSALTVSGIVSLSIGVVLYIVAMLKDVSVKMESSYYETAERVVNMGNVYGALSLQIFSAMLIIVGIILWVGSKIVNELSSVESE